MQWTARGIAGAKIRRKNEIWREYRRKTENSGEKRRKIEKYRGNRDYL